MSDVDITRIAEHCRAVGEEDSLPPLAPEEHLWLEELAGRRLTTEEAHRILRVATLEAAFQRWWAEKARE